MKESFKISCRARHWCWSPPCDMTSWLSWSYGCKYTIISKIHGGKIISSSAALCIYHCIPNKILSQNHRLSVNLFQSVLSTRVSWEQSCEQWHTSIVSRGDWPTPLFGVTLLRYSEVQWTSAAHYKAVLCSTLHNAECRMSMLGYCWLIRDLKWGSEYPQRPCDRSLSQLTASFGAN